MLPEELTTNVTVFAATAFAALGGWAGVRHGTAWVVSRIDEVVKKTENEIAQLREQLKGCEEKHTAAAIETAKLSGYIQALKDKGGSA